MDMDSSETKELWPYAEKAARVELIIRFFYGIIVGIIFWLWGLWASIATFLHFWYILILGRRSPTLYRHTRRYLNATAYVNYYLMFLTDSRPDLTPNIILHYTEAQPEAKSSTQAKFCVSCGTEIPVEATFCPKCGKEQK